jgi:RNA recognition motif-containing protein
VNICVGHRARQGTEEDPQQAFEAHGQVASATVIKDRYIGESRGLGFAEMSAKAKAAIDKLNGTALNGKSLNVDGARPR